MSVVVFDLDGTLVDSLPDIHAAALATLAEAGLPPVGPEQTRSFIGDGMPKLVERLMRATGADMERHAALLDRFLAHYGAAPAARSTLYPAVAETLAALAKNHALGVCTNKPVGPARAVLSHFGLLEHMGTVVGGDSLGVIKPDPAPLARAIADLGGGPALYVGDSEVDGRTAEAAGVPFALFTGGYRRAPVDEIPHDDAFGAFAALPGIVARLLLPGAA
ncbi:MAG TPA: phosphoglycolate phosphatase [Thermohalobaculum sp.]|nr:phosphoglycolate phosphatase [Thermohalobaculum sp.]